MTNETTTTTSDATAIVDTYLAAWNATDRGERAELADRALGADLWYRDSLLEIDGVDAFVDTIGAVQEQFPGHVMTRTSDIDAHHDVVRFNWALAAPGKSPAISGVDLAKFDADGKLHRIVGFSPETIA